MVQFLLVSAFQGSIYEWMWKYCLHASKKALNHLKRENIMCKPINDATKNINGSLWCLMFPPNMRCHPHHASNKQETEYYVAELKE